jgi:3',5'-cyclic AMP phosphodiesterase CpdA
MVDLIAHLSDPHLDAGAASRQRFDRAVGYLRSVTAPLTAIVVTSDIIEAGAVEEYAHVAAALDGIAPTLYCPGNSDQRGPFRAALLSDQVAATDIDGPINYARTLGERTFIMLDSSVPGDYRGALDEGTLAWLRATLAALPRSATVILGLHHPPVEVGHPGVDRVRLQDPAPLAQALRNYPQIAAVLVGHTHAATATTFAERPLLIAPGLHARLRLPWEADAVTAPLIDPSAPPALALHLLHDDRRITTYYQTLD